MALTSSIVICTRNRPDDLGACLGSLDAQARLPDEVVVVDASDGEASRMRVAAWAAASPVGRQRHVAAAPGLTRQRNLGIDATAGDVVTFLDDDVVLEPGYLAAVLALFERDRGWAAPRGRSRRRSSAAGGGRRTPSAPSSP
jgi:glycosyltransferase involved in cell wall biosynthesis